MERLRQDVLETLEGWEPTNPEEAYRRALWRALAADHRLLTRAGDPAHFTASALPVTTDGRSVCLVLHRRLGLWVQPGGHLEMSDDTVSGAARREMIEETGLDGRVDPVPVRLSRHPAPCRAGAWHLDLQLVTPCEAHPPTVSPESLDVAWFEVERLPAELAPGVADLVRAARERISRTGSREQSRPGE